jgi:hypothetical protein
MKPPTIFQLRLILRHHYRLFAFNHQWSENLIFSAARQRCQFKMRYLAGNRIPVFAEFKTELILMH